MDCVCEQLVSKKRTGADVLKVIGLILAAAIVSMLCVLGAGFISPILFFGVPGAIALCVWLVRNINSEYEYIITNNQMDVDKIIAKSRRKRMITIDLSKAQDFTEKEPPENGNRAKTTVHASSGNENDVAYLFVEHGDYGTVMLIFSPNEKTKKAIVQQVPGMLRTRLQSHAK
ncbi:MAG: hypothetical protein K2N06_09870 [Oscillospiraceae bacterium]|nr:hypothetical protein [Oscillospiraceae bacterium]